MQFQPSERPTRLKHLLLAEAVVFPLNNCSNKCQVLQAARATNQQDDI